MTHRKVYATFVDRIFGPGTATFDQTDTQTNHALGAISAPAKFFEFVRNFEGRLRRLENATKIDNSLRTEILSAINKIATKEWDGAYAELCALDYFLADPQTGPGNVELDRTVPAGETLAFEMGMTNANHDLSFPSLPVSMDTKLLSDKIGGILEGIFNDFRKIKGISQLPIVASYNLGDDFEPYQTNRKKLLNEIDAGVDVTMQPATFASNVIQGLSYKFAWKRGVYMGVHNYSPSKHAASHHRLLFGHAKKFSCKEPTIIVFVVFPWSGERVFPFKNSKYMFFRNFGNHFFSDYLQSTEPASKYNSKFKTMITAGEVTRHLSGIIYLEDTAITSKTPTELNIEASFLWNPNAIHTLENSSLEKNLRTRGAHPL